MRSKFMRFPGGKAKAVTLSYDDGVRDDLRFSDIISAHGMKCTFNYNSAINNGLTDEEVKEYVLSRGHEIAIHGANHRPTGILRPIEGIRDMLDCRLALEKRFGIIVRGCAYPDTGITLFANGTNYQMVKNYLTELDIAYSRTLGSDNDSFRLPADFHAWMPTVHHSNPAVMDYVDKFIELDLSTKLYHPKRDVRLFYMWGHSFEFGNAGNWSLLEDICSRLGGRDDMWYATNIEIYDYVKAYNSLIYSADGSTVYNPTLFDVWFDVDGRLFCVESGKTLRFE